MNGNSKILTVNWECIFLYNGIEISFWDKLLRERSLFHQLSYSHVLAYFLHFRWEKFLRINSLFKVCAIFVRLVKIHLTMYLTWVKFSESQILLCCRASSLKQKEIESWRSGTKVEI